MRKFVSIVVVGALSACSPIPMDDTSATEQSENFTDVEVAHEFIENGEGPSTMVSTVRSEDAVYTVEIAPTGGLDFTTTWTVEYGPCKCTPS